MIHSANSKSMLLAIALLMPLAAMAQTSVMVTNWVSPDENTRYYNGNIYFVNHSSLWKQFATWNGLGPTMGGMDGGRKSICNVVVAKHGAMTVVNILQQTVYVDAYGVFDKDDKEYLRSVAVVNYPKEVITGDSIAGYCIRSTNVVTPTGAILPVYDFGIQCTNPVPVVSVKKPVAQRFP